MKDQEPRSLASDLARGLTSALPRDIASNLPSELERALDSGRASNLARPYKDGRSLRAIDPHDPLVQWNVKVPSKVKDAACRLAQRRGVSIAGLLRILVAEALAAECR